MASKHKTHLDKDQVKNDRLLLLKERYKKLILEPRKEIETEIDRDLREEGTFEETDDSD